MREVFEKYFKHVDVIYFKTPSKIASVNYKKLVDELNEMKFDDDEVKKKKIKKMIFNINIGLLEKQRNTVRKSFVFNKMVDAFYYQEIYGGTINVINQLERDEEDELGFRDIISQEKHYVLNISDTKALMNGYRYIKELVLQNHNYAMNTAYETLLENNINVYSVKTDAFVIDMFNLKKAKELLKFSNAIGDWKWNSKYIIAYKQFCKQVSLLPSITKYTNETGTVKDEWDTDEIINEHILTNKRLMIRGVYAGSGKSYICKHMQSMGYKVLFVVHSNDLGQQCGCEWATINKFFSIAFGDERLTKFDYSNFDVIVFDEIYFHSPSKWELIWNFCIDNPDKIVLATGDTNQLKSPEKVSNIYKFEDYANHCIDLVFENNILLYECKRLKNEEDKLKLKDVKHLSLKTKTKYKDIIDKYFKWTDEIEMYENNIAYTNNTCKTVSKKIREMKGIKDEYIIGEEVICRKYMKIAGKKMNKNYRYEVANNDRFITLKHTCTGDMIDVKIYLVRKHFIYAYCFTAHSKQGCSVDGDIVIYDWNKWYVEREWFFTAITRARDFDRVKFFRYKDDEDDSSRKDVENYFRKKVAGCKEQDTKAGRDIEGDYVDVEFLMDLMNTNCECCGDILTIDMEDGNIVSNISCQRLNNDISHYKSNVVGYCVSCNCAFSNKISL